MWKKNAFIINTEQFGEFARFYKLCKWTVSHKLDSGKTTLAALFNLSWSGCFPWLVISSSFYSWMEEIDPAEVYQV